MEQVWIRRQFGEKGYTSEDRAVPFWYVKIRERKQIRAFLLLDTVEILQSGENGVIGR